MSRGPANVEAFVFQLEAFAQLERGFDRLPAPEALGMADAILVDCDLPLQSDVDVAAGFLEELVIAVRALHPSADLIAVFQKLWTSSVVRNLGPFTKGRTDRL